MVCLRHWEPVITQIHIKHQIHYLHLRVCPSELDNKSDKWLTPAVAPPFRLTLAHPSDTLHKLAPIKEHRKQSATQAGASGINLNLPTDWKTTCFTSNSLTFSVLHICAGIGVCISQGVILTGKIQESKIKSFDNYIKKKKICTPVPFLPHPPKKKNILNLPCDLRKYFMYFPWQSTSGMPMGWQK